MGYKTTEFWLTAISNIAGALLAIWAGRGLISSQEADQYLVLVQSLAVAFIPISLAIINKAYIDSRAKVKEASVTISGIQMTTGAHFDEESK